MPVEVVNREIGPEFVNYFISEFGVTTFSSFESISSLLDSSHWGIHGGQRSDTCTNVYDELNQCTGANPMSERNYPCDNHIITYFGDEGLEEVGEDAFKRQLYQCMISQAIWTKAQIEHMRNTNSFGSLIWQLNENWPTGGWGLVEYGSRRDQPGQVLGGRWKPLMYLLQQSLFRDVFATCGKKGVCYCRNDGLLDFRGYLVIDSWDLVTGEVETLMSRLVSLKGGGGIGTSLFWCLFFSANPIYSFLIPSSCVVLRRIFLNSNRLSGLLQRAVNNHVID